MVGRFNKGRSERKGVAAVEMALVLPFLVYLFLATVDFCRVFYYTSICTFAARDGALYGAAELNDSNSPTGTTATASDIQARAVSDGANINLTTSNVAVAQGTDSLGYAYVKVTVTKTFTPVTNFPWIPTSVSITRSEQARVAAALPS